MTRAESAGLFDGLPADMLTPLGSVGDGKVKVHLFAITASPQGKPD